MAESRLTLVPQAEQSAGRRGYGTARELRSEFGRILLEHDRPRLIIQANAKQVWSSPSAERLLHSPFPVYLKGGRLCFESGQSAREGNEFLSSLGPEHARLYLSSASGCWVLLSGCARQFDNERLLFLSFSLSQPATNSVASGLASYFGLTRAEAHVLDELARLRSPAEIALELQVSVNTVRSHIKRIHAKMSVNSSTRLLQIVRAFGDS